jgi:hypothetical protein
MKRVMLRTALTVVLLIHGVAHLPGFLVPWRLAALPQMPYRTTLLDGRIDAGAVGIRIVGLCWLLAAFAMVAAAVATFRGSPAWPALTLGAATFSLVLCVLGLPEARIGLVVDLALIVGVLLAASAGWLPGPSR